MKDQQKIEALHNKIESLHDDLDGFAGQFGCDDAKDNDFMELVTIEGLQEAGLNEEESELFMALATETDADNLKKVAHHIYWSAK